MQKDHGLRPEKVKSTLGAAAAGTSSWRTVLTRLAVSVVVAALVFTPVPLTSPTGHYRFSQASAADPADANGADGTEGAAGASSGADDPGSLSDLEKAIQEPSGGDANASAASSASDDDALLQDAAKSANSASASAKTPPTETSSPAGKGGDGDLALPDDNSGGKAGEAAGAGQATAGAAASDESAGSGDGSDVSSEQNTITNVEFKMDGTTSRILLHAKSQLQYREVKNPQSKQVVYYFDNTEIPQRLQRAFDTSEFPSPVALFTVLQMPQDKPPLTKLIVQLRESKEPVVVSNKSGLSIDFPPPDHKGEPKILIGDNDANGPQEGSGYSANRSFTKKNLKLLEVKNSDVQDVLRMLAKTSGYNIIVGDDVSGKVGTLSLQDVPWDQAFALVLQSKKLGYVRQGNIIRVATLASLKTEKDDELANEQARIRVEPLKTVLIPISYASASGIMSQAQGFLSQRGTMSVDARTNTVILKDIESVVAKVQKLFAALDTQPPSVSISARIMQVDSNFNRSIGFGALTFNETTAGLNFNSNTLFTGGGASSTVISAPQFANLAATLQLGELDNKVKTLANPSVTVMANSQAMMMSTITLYVVTAGNVAGGFAALPVINQINATLSLNVTPLVANDGTINLKVMLQNQVPTGTTPPITVNSRNVNTQILLANGDTAVLGGIFQDTVTDGKQGIPFLMDIPILGILFSDLTSVAQRSETFVFITAKILNAEDAFKRSI